MTIAAEQIKFFSRMPTLKQKESFTVAISHTGALKHFLTIELFKLVIVVKAELRVLINGIMIHKGRRKVEKVKRE